MNQATMRTEDDYPFTEGDRVCHVKDSRLEGIVTHIDRNLEHPTTCNVSWSGHTELDIIWTNKLVLLGLQDTKAQ